MGLPHGRIIVPYSSLVLYIIKQLMMHNTPQDSLFIPWAMFLLAIFLSTVHVRLLTEN